MAEQKKKLAGQAIAHGVSLAAGTGFIVWLFSTFSVVIPAAAAAFLAGLLVPVMNKLLKKLEDLIDGSN